MPKQWRHTHLSKLQLFGDLNCYYSTPQCVCQTHKRCELRSCQAAASAIYQSPLSEECSARRGKQILSQMRPPLCFCNLIRPSISGGSPIVSGFSTFAGVATRESLSDELRASGRFATSNALCGGRGEWWGLPRIIPVAAVINLQAAAEEQIAPPALDLAER
jgi:hypothetical protein